MFLYPVTYGQAAPARPTVRFDLDRSVQGIYNEVTGAYTLSFQAERLSVTEYKVWGVSGHVLVNERPLGLLDVSEWWIQQSNSAWKWILSDEDLATIERCRRGGDFAPSFSVTGLMETVPRGSPGPAKDLWPFHGGGRLRVAKSDWSDLLTTMKYVPTTSMRWPIQNANWPGWSEARQSLDAAVSHLTRGENYQALTSCLDALEKKRATPYLDGSWRGLFDVEPEKEDGLAKILSGLATYLNKVGHHRSKTRRDASQDLARTSVEHWEAEILVGMSMLAMMYIQRLPVVTVEAPSKDSP